MKQIKIKCPAKINLNLKVTGKRPDGFHNIESIMQTIDLYDYLDIKISNSDENKIILTGNNFEIPYDEKNLVYKATKLFTQKTNIEKYKIEVYIDKNIPVCAGLAGGSTDGAGVLYGLNKLFSQPLDKKSLHQLCSELGSDLNVCLEGGKIIAKGRGEIIKPMDFEEFGINLIKPIDLGISAKEAYTKFSQKIDNKIDIDTRKNFANDLEWAIIDTYPQLQHIKQKYPSSIMTGSGSTYYSLKESFKSENNYWVKNNLKSIPTGCQEVN